MRHLRSFASRHRKLTVLLCIVLALAIAGGAYAIWSMSASTNKLQASTASTINITFTTPTAGDLAAATQCVPGGSCALTAEVSNPSSAPITLVSYQPSGANEFDDAGSLCPVGASNLTGPAETTATTAITPNVVVPANAVNFTFVIPNALSLAATASTACQGKTLIQTSGTTSVNFTAGS